jgi:hypothetical protein
VTGLEGERPLDHVRETDKGELRQAVDLPSVAHGGDEMGDSVVGPEQIILKIGGQMSMS